MASSLRWLHLATACALVPHLGVTQVVHLEHNRGWSNGSVSNAALDGRIREAAAQYRSYAPVPRVAFFDVAYPKDCAELAALKGYAVMVVSAVAQDSSELPPARVYATLGAGQQPLSQVAGIQSRVADTTISATFGPYRHDALYLLPIAASRASADVLLDFAAHRQGFRLAHLSGQLPHALEPCSGVPAERQESPPPAVWRLVVREYPDLTRVLSPPH